MASRVAAPSYGAAAPAAASLSSLLTTASYEYVSTVDERLCCPICQAPMLNPYMSKTCEHFYCYECILQHLGSSDSPGTCPCDRSPLSLEQGPYDEKQLVPAPRLVKLLCDELEVRCTSGISCSWAGQRCHWERHQAECSARVPNNACPYKNCGYQGDDLQSHKRTCSKKAVPCEACKECIVQERMEAHLDECRAQAVTCPNCKQAGLAKSNLQHHLDNDCTEITINCTHVRYGCTWQGKRGNLASDHLSSKCIYEPLKDVLGAHEERLLLLESENANLHMGLSALRDTYQDLDRRVRHLARGVGLPPSHHDSARDHLPVTERLTDLTTQISDLRRTSDRQQVTSERSMHDIKENMSNMQMMLHDLRGELMALQHAHHYENVYRSWGRNYQAETISGDAKGNGTSNDIKSKDGVSTTNMQLPTAGPSFPAIGQQGYPFPLYTPIHPGQMQHTPPFFGSPLAVPYGPRRWSGWPYGYGGATFPEERTGGVKL